MIETILKFFGILPYDLRSDLKEVKESVYEERARLIKAYDDSVKAYEKRMQEYLKIRQDELRRIKSRDDS